MYSIRRAHEASSFAHGRARARIGGAYDSALGGGRARARGRESRAATREPGAPVCVSLCVYAGISAAQVGFSGQTNKNAQNRKICVDQHAANLFVSAIREEGGAQCPL
ncbi:hypothetical protein [Rhodosalinus sediminis]|uniref:hypothetical protein n=1 Tax=Rhodosalinus sediminis TaxID=1940533 RepID=UPI0023547256|nr:hypothetical protein [Rhodosalinus sediminis]